MSAGAVRRYWMRSWYEAELAIAHADDDECGCLDKCKKVVLASDYDALHAQPVWTTNKPTVAGAYWWRRKSSQIEARPYWVYPINGRLYVGDCGWIDEFTGGEWAGPLPLPKEAT